MIVHEPEINDPGEDSGAAQTWLGIDLHSEGAKVVWSHFAPPVCRPGQGAFRVAFAVLQAWEARHSRSTLGQAQRKACKRQSASDEHLS